MSIIKQSYDWEAWKKIFYYQWSVWPFLDMHCKTGTMYFCTLQLRNFIKLFKIYIFALYLYTHFKKNLCEWEIDNETISLKQVCIPIGL